MHLLIYFAQYLNISLNWRHRKMMTATNSQIKLIDKQRKPAKQLTKKERLGKIGELIVYNPLRKAVKQINDDLPRDKILRVEWTGKNAYQITGNNGKHNPDFKIYLNGELIKTYEMKNWRNGFNYGCETAKTEVIDRFNNCAYNYQHGLIISFLSCFGKPAQQLINKSCHNSVITTDKLIGSKDFKNRDLFANLLTQFIDDITNALTQRLTHAQQIQQQLNSILNQFKPKPDPIFSMLQQIQSISSNVDTAITVNTNQSQQITKTNNTQNSNLIDTTNDSNNNDLFVWSNGCKIPLINSIECGS